MLQWFGKVDASKVDLLFLAALLQETGKILIADEIAKNNETFQFRSEIESCSNIADVERMFVRITSSEVTARIFKHWKFDKTMVEAIEYTDTLGAASDAIRPYAFALKVVKTAIPLNSPLSERSITLALNLLEKEQCDKTLFLEVINKLKEYY